MKKTKMNVVLCRAVLLFALMAVPAAVRAEDATKDPAPAEVQAAEVSKAEDYTIVIKDRNFSPRDLIIPAGQKVKIIVKNEETTPVEFESHDLHREKVIVAGGEAVISVGPLEPGSYVFFDEFHPETPEGTITAK